MKRSPALLVCATILVGAGLTACSSDSNEGMVGGPSVCDDATITKAVQSALDADGEGMKVFALDGLTCADGWAVAMPTIGTEEANAITVTDVFQAEGQFWIPKDRAAVCGTQDMNDPSKYPSDAQIPESLYDEGCNTN